MDKTIDLMCRLRKRPGYDSDADLQEAVQALGDLKSQAGRLNHELNEAHVAVARLRGNCRWRYAGEFLWDTACGTTFEIPGDLMAVEPYCPRCGGRTALEAGDAD